MDSAFPGSKDMLWVRDSAKQCHEFLVRFRSRRLVKRTVTKKMATVEDISGDPEPKMFFWWVRELVVTSCSEERFPEAFIEDYYKGQSYRVMDYFRHGPGELSVISWSEPEAMKRLCKLLGHGHLGQKQSIFYKPRKTV